MEIAQSEVTPKVTDTCVCFTKSSILVQQLASFWSLIRLWTCRRTLLTNQSVTKLESSLLSSDLAGLAPSSSRHSQRNLKCTKVWRRRVCLASRNECYCVANSHPDTHDRPSRTSVSTQHDHAKSATLSLELDLSPPAKTQDEDRIGITFP